MNARRIADNIFSITLILALLLSGVRVHAQGVVQLPVPGTRLELSPVFAPPLLKGVKVYRNDPFRFDFILDRGDAAETDVQLKTDSQRLIKYFLASLTVPEKDLWVNLSPYEKDRIVPDAFGQTEMGRDLLAQDYILKQITASVIYPEGEVGKEFWAKVYAEAQRRYGSTDVQVDTFNKVWIIPEKATVYENMDSAFVVESKLKVMLEEDYLALDKNIVVQGQAEPAANQLGSEIVREVVIPILEKEVNEGKNFAPLRQVYHSLILATWYKRKVKVSIMGQAYVDKQKTAGIVIADKNEKEKIWAQYVEAFKKGAYNFIKEEVNSATQQGVVPRRYFSGGADMAMNVFKGTTDSSMRPVIQNKNMVIEAKLDLYSDRAMNDSSQAEDMVVAIPADWSVDPKRIVYDRNTDVTRKKIETKFAVSVVIMNQEGKVLFAKRNPVEGGVWSLPSSFIRMEDDPNMLRILSPKVQATLGVTVKKITVIGKRMGFRRDSDGKQWQLLMHDVFAEVYSGEAHQTGVVNETGMPKYTEFGFFDPKTFLAGADGLYDLSTSGDCTKCLGTIVNKGSYVEFEKAYSAAQLDRGRPVETGGIDLNPSKINMAIKSSDEEIKFDIDPAMLERLQKSSGVTPVIIGIHSLDSLSAFMGMQAAGIEQ